MDGINSKGKLCGMKLRIVNSGENPGQLKIHWWVWPDIGSRKGRRGLVKKHARRGSYRHFSRGR